MTLSNALLQAYRDSHYELQLPHQSCVLQIDQPAPALSVWLRAQRCSAAAFISAHNPYSRQLPAAINCSRHAALEQVLLARQYRLYPGRGYHPDAESKWPPEQGFLILAIDRDTAIGLGSSVAQHAVLFIPVDAPVELLLCPGKESSR